MTESFDKFRSLVSPQGIKAALIDMDGTLYDSMPNHARAWMRVMADIGVDARSEEFFLYEGCTGAWIINHMIERQFGRPATESEKKDFYARKAEYFVQMPEVSPVEGARELVDTLLRHGVTTVLVTGSGQNSLLSRLDRDFPGAFPAERRVTSASVTHGKPHPEPYLRGLALAGVADPRQAVAIDNAPLGTLSGHAAGIPTVGVVTGPIDADVLATNGADIVFISMADCAKNFPRLLFK